MRKNLEPKQWGPGGWQFLRDCVYACDDASRESYLQLMRLLPNVLPCAACRQHCRAFLETNPPEAAPDLAEWLDTFEWEVAVRVRPALSWSGLVPVLVLLLIVTVAAVVLFTKNRSKVN